MCSNAARLEMVALCHMLTNYITKSCFILDQQACRLRVTEQIGSYGKVSASRNAAQSRCGLGPPTRDRAQWWFGGSIFVTRSFRQSLLQHRSCNICVCLLNCQVNQRGSGLKERQGPHGTATLFAVSRWGPLGWRTPTFMRASLTPSAPLFKPYL